MAKLTKSNTVEPVVYRKGNSTANADQLRALKTMAFASGKKGLGLADKDIRTILKGVHMPNANLSVGAASAARLGVSYGDANPTDPIRGGDPVGPGQDGDPPFWRTDMDPSDPAKREDRSPFA